MSHLRLIYFDLLEIRSECPREEPADLISSKLQGMSATVRCCYVTRAYMLMVGPVYDQSWAEPQMSYRASPRLGFPKSHRLAGAGV